MSRNSIEWNVRSLMEEIPAHVKLVAAAKTRSEEEIKTVIDAGVRIVGHNYVSEALNTAQAFKGRARCHMIGHLQRNKVSKAVEIFDMVETLDSLRLAKELDKKAGNIGKVMPVLIEVNSAEETQKYGVMPSDVMEFAGKIEKFENLSLEGLMTMGPLTNSPEEARKYFSRTREVFEELKAMGAFSSECAYLSMGMSATYKVAIEEGANMVRVGTAIFGPRVTG